MTSIRSSSGPGMVFSGVGSRDEQHLGEVKGHLDVVVTEGGILLAIQHFQQG